MQKKIVLVLLFGVYFLQAQEAAKTSDQTITQTAPAAPSTPATNANQNAATAAAQTPQLTQNPETAQTTAVQPVAATPGQEAAPAQAPAPATQENAQPAAEQKTEAPAVTPAPQEQTVMPQEAAPVQAPASGSQETVQKAPEQKTEQKPESAAPAPAQQEAPKAATPQATEAEDLEIKGINTVDIEEPKGNWLYKRIWWEKAERLYEKTKQLADNILEYRIIYYARRKELDQNLLNSFYFTFGFEQGELNELLDTFGKQLEEEKVEGTLDAHERELLKTINQEKKVLDELKQSMALIGKADNALDESLRKLAEQLQQVKMYEQQSWENFKAINKELSEKKARELYYGMVTYWKNLNNINAYLSDPFMKYFDQLIGKIDQEVEHINTTIQGLKERGIDLQAQAQKLRKCPLPTKTEEVATPENEQEETTGFLGTVWYWVTSPFVLVGDMLTGAYDWVTSWFGGGEHEETKE